MNHKSDKMKDQANIFNKSLDSFLLIRYIRSIRPITDEAMKRIMIIIALISGCDSYDLEQEKRDQYCDMVKAGAWPEYDSSTNCEKDQ